MDPRRRHLERAGATTYPRMRCALLEDGDRCGTYDYRPFSCRRGHSFDADTCRRAKEGEAGALPVDARVIGIYNEISTAFREATAAFGGDPLSYELHQVLDILLDDASADLSAALETNDQADEVAIQAASEATSAALRGG